MKSQFKSLSVPVFGHAGDMAAVELAARLAVSMKAEISLHYVGRSLSLLTEKEEQGYWSRYKSGGFKAAFDLLDGLFETRMKERAAEAEHACSERMKLHKIKKLQEPSGKGASLPHFTWDQDLDPKADVSQIIVSKALLSDCTIISNAAMAEAGQHELAIMVPAEAGRPLIIHPGTGASADEPARHVMIAWKNTVHTIRAIDQAMPILQGAEQVSILEIDEGGKQGQVAAEQVAHLLSLHGIKAHVVTAEAGSLRPQEILDRELAKQGCDFLVMGAYSRPRTREIIFGGFTEHVLDNMKVPTLFAH